MAKLTIYLVAIALAAVLEIGLSGSIGHYKNWDQFSGQHIGFATGKCSALSGILPDPKSGCCGKHAGADSDNGGGEEHNTHNGNNDIGDGDEDTDSDRDDDTDNGNNETGDGDENADSDLGDDPDNENNEISDSNEDSDSGDDNGEGNGNGDDWAEDIGDIFEGVGGIVDDVGSIFDYLGLQDEQNSGPIGFNLKNVVEQNASDIAPDGYITAGKPAGLRQYPWLVHLNIKIPKSLMNSIVLCGGSLISPRFVLTAAHCLQADYRSYEDVSIFLAEYNTNTYPTDCIGETCIKNVVMHPEKIITHKGFNPYRLTNDIALMRLRGSAPYTDYIRPICLPPFNIDNPKNEGAPLSIAGWGSTGHKTSPIKLTAEVQLITHNKCQRYYDDLTASHICAASVNGQDTCQGDSGGPIMAEHDGNFYVIGIVSGKSGAPSCGSSVPTLYTNVFAHRQWIQDNMKV